MKTEPCTVCGERETKLIDGFYYCTECGTQDVNAQETVVEHVVLHDGTTAFTTKTKIKTVLKDAIQMSGEWRKWHALNFIILGLVKELMALGASSSYKERVLWIWTKYMNEFMHKDKMGAVNENQKEPNKSIFDDMDEDYSQESNNDYEKVADDSPNKIKVLRETVKIFTNRVLVSILYLGLLFDRSPIQLSHLLRFINEKRVSLKMYLKFVPKELNVSSIPEWSNFMFSINPFTGRDIPLLRRTAMSLLKVLDLDMPAFPDIRKLVETFVTELSLPNHFINLVFALIFKSPCDLIVNCKARLVGDVKLPNYEVLIMSYVVVALKMCFGLDDEYEIEISDAVDKINDDENRLKSYKLGMYSDPTNRLFSFREWSNYLQYRKLMLCKHYLPIAEQYNLEVDDYVFLEHLGERPKKPIRLGDEITMDILNKIPSLNEGQVIPYTEFVPSLTPWSSYTEVVTRHVQDPEIKLLMSEDFTQYSLRYACEYLELDVNGTNIIEGVTKENKVFNKCIVGTLTDDVQIDKTMVYVRNCENKNWLKTNPPSIDHVTKVSDTLDRDSDHGYDSNSENRVNNTTVVEEEESQLEKVNNTTVVDDEKSVSENNTDTTFVLEEDLKIENIEEEKEGVSIFDDPFNDIDNSYENEEDKEDVESFNFWTQFRQQPTQINAAGEYIGRQKSVNSETSLVETVYNPETFDRARVIKELILHACNKYKITIPKDFNPNPKKSVKRPRYETKSTDETKPKKPKYVRRNPSDYKLYIEKILSAYQASIEKDWLSKVSEHVDSFVNMIDYDNEGDQINNLCSEKSDHMITDDIQETPESKELSILETETPIADDSSVKEPDDDDLLPKINPNFDEKTHDIKQLYVKYRDRLQFEDILDIHDPEIEKVLEEKIVEYRYKDPSTAAKDLREHDDDESLSNVSQDPVPKQIVQKNKKRVGKDNYANFPKLLALHKQNITEFGYWIRYYNASKVIRNDECKELFNAEIRQTMPKSFLFVLNQCASIILCSPFAIYKTMMYLENNLFETLPRHRWSRRSAKTRAGPAYALRKRKS